jgi:hypothetical protein
MPFIYNDQISFKNPITGNPTLLPSPSSDPYINNVVLFINGNIADSSPSNNTLTNFGAVLSNAQVKYNPNSIFVNGNDQFLTAPISNDFNLGTGDFTIEFWLRLNTAPTTANGNTFIDSRIDITNITNNYACSITPDLRFTIGTINGNQFFCNNAISLNTWTHIACSRVSGVVKIFLNGVLDFTASFPDNMIQSGNLKIMANAYRQFVPNTISPNCYFDSLRITKGIGRYTANFDAENDTYLN